MLTLLFETTGAVDIDSTRCRSILSRDVAVKYKPRLNAHPISVLASRPIRVQYESDGAGDVRAELDEDDRIRAGHRHVGRVCHAHREGTSCIE